jgi:hypothetical protein
MSSTLAKLLVLLYAHSFHVAHTAEPPPERFVPGVVNFVVGTDERYVMQTLVTLHSLMKHITGKIRIFVLLYRSAWPYAGLIRTAVFAFAKQYSNEAVEVVFVNTNAKQFAQLAAKFGAAEAKLRRFDEIYLQAKSALPFATAGVSLDKVSSPLFRVPHYMWLDSDTLITKNLREVYEHLVEVNTAFGATNLEFFHEQMLVGGVGVVSPCPDKWCKSRYVWPGPRSLALFGELNHNVWRSSGGVVFVNADIFRAWVMRYPNWLILETVYNFQDLNDDEEALDLMAGLLLFSSMRGKDCFEKRRQTLSPVLTPRNCPVHAMYALPLQYNCKPTLMPTISALSHASFSPSDGEDGQNLRESWESAKGIAEDPKSVAVWHWDRILKPWLKGAGKGEYADELWHAECREVIDTIDSMGGETLGFYPEWRLPKMTLDGVDDTPEWFLWIGDRATEVIFASDLLSHGIIPFFGGRLHFGEHQDKVITSSNLDPIKSTVGGQVCIAGRMYHVHRVMGDGDCAFTALGVTRNDVADRLLARIGEPAIRRLLVKLINTQIVAGQLPNEFVNVVSFDNVKSLVKSSGPDRLKKLADSDLNFFTLFVNTFIRTRAQDYVGASGIGDNWANAGVLQLIAAAMEVTIVIVDQNGTEMQRFGDGTEQRIIMNYDETHYEKVLPITPE